MVYDRTLPLPKCQLPNTVQDFPCANCTSVPMMIARLQSVGDISVGCDENPWFAWELSVQSWAKLKFIRKFLMRLQVAVCSRLRSRPQTVSGDFLLKSSPVPHHHLSSSLSSRESSIESPIGRPNQASPIQTRHVSKVSQLNSQLNPLSSSSSQLKWASIHKLCWDAKKNLVCYCICIAYLLDRADTVFVFGEIAKESMF